MQINKTTIRIQASLNYQVSELAVEIENYTEEELAGYTQYLVETCSQTVKDLSATVGPTHTTNQQSQQKPVVQVQRQAVAQSPRVSPAVQNQGFSNRQQYQPAPASGPNVRFASEKQIQYLRSFGWQGNPQGLTWTDADTLLKQYKQANGIQ